MSDMFHGEHTSQAANEGLQLQEQSLIPNILSLAEGVEASAQVRESVRHLGEKSEAQVEVEAYQEKVAGQVRSALNFLFAYIQTYPQATKEEIKNEREKIINGMEKPAQNEVRDKIDDYFKSQDKFRPYLHFENGVKGPKGHEEDKIVDSITFRLLEFMTQNPEATTDEIRRELIAQCKKKNAGIRIISRVFDKMETMRSIQANNDNSGELN